MPDIQFTLPAFTVAEAIQLARQYYGLAVQARPLPGERDQNFLLQTETESGPAYVLKISNAAEPFAALDLQNRALAHLAEHAPGLALPRVVVARSGETILPLPNHLGGVHWLRMLTYLPGEVWAEVHPHSAELLHSLGQTLGVLDRALQTFSHPAARRELKWDLAHAGWASSYVHRIADAQRRALATRILTHYTGHITPVLPTLRASIIYNDANDHNILVSTGEAANRRVVGVIDFGDMVLSPVVCELAIACAYASLNQPDALAAITQVVAGYQAVFPLTDLEVEVLFPLILTRLAVSVTNSAYQRQVEPDNAYLVISERPAWETLEKLAVVSWPTAHAALRAACGLPAERAELPTETILHLRRERLGRNLSLAYQQPVHIVRGVGQYLYDVHGRRYLDAVNNVAHVGHCHPRVVAAGQAQMALLNTNSRYLHTNIVRYAERLTALLPAPLSVVYFVCSGSEANELALRIARTYTRNHETIVLEGAYHGNTSALIDVSPYKYEGRGGAGPKPFVHKVSIPDTYRGPFKADDAQAGEKYAHEVAEIVARLAGRGQAPTFLCESMLGSAGQIPLAPGYLRPAYAAVRAAGGVCIADEVQVGLGRVGTHVWGFETQGVVPDIVTIGKPIGNGHPLGAVVTTPALAEAFNNGMEYFNTFGGNPVSCAIGLAVLDVLHDEGLQAQALQVGQYFMAGLRQLQNQRPLIGDVRGAGLFIGVELVTHRATLERGLAEAAQVVNRMKDHGILISHDFNTLKIKPPLPFTRADADFFVDTLEAVLQEDFARAP